GVLLGGINTVVLIGASLTIVLAVHGARVGHRRMLLVCLGLTILLGSVFLGIKAIEWTHKWEDGLVPGLRFALTGADAGPEELFFLLYFAMTGVHALHLVIGICVVGVILALAWRGHYTPAYHNPVEVTGLYWHFVVLFFMHLRESSGLVWVVAGGGFFWLAILIALTMSDVLTRGWLPVSGP